MQVRQLWARSRWMIPCVLSVWLMGCQLNPPVNGATVQPAVDSSEAVTSGDRNASDEPAPQCFVAQSSLTRLDSPCSGDLIPLSQLSTNNLHPKKVSGSARGAENEADLLLSRGDGQFFWRNMNLAKIFVCRAHYEQLMANKPYDPHTHTQPSRRIHLQVQGTSDAYGQSGQGKDRHPEEVRSPLSS